ncbi:ParA family protein [Micromonospora haikouensis]|uniref:ParA family protein n=1 Tax=Micromonospora haikouensis TaxID=686309 RepID=UPI0033CDFB36
MRSYAFWNNKGGVGKSFLCFVAACQYAEDNPDADVYVIDLCPQANVSETLLGGYQPTDPPISKLTSATPRATIAGYLEARLNSPFQMIDDIEPFVVSPSDYNPAIPKNLFLSCGDNLLEILSEAIRQTSQLSIPLTAWKQVIEWVRDLTLSFARRSGDRDTIVLIDCNPSFSVYTQQALVAAENLIVPFTADDSSRRGIENVMALLYGVGDSHVASYARINFAKRALEDAVATPRLHTFVSNRVTLYGDQASRAFAAVQNSIAATLAGIYRKHRSVFAYPHRPPAESFVQVPDYHSACIVSAFTGTPVHSLKAGPRTILGERIQINVSPLTRYKSALSEFVEQLL